MRGYCVYADEPPQYNVFYIFQITGHEYGRNPVKRYDEDAGEVLAELRRLETVTGTERYLAERDAHDADAIRELLNHL